MQLEWREVVERTRELRTNLFTMISYMKKKGFLFFKGTYLKMYHKIVLIFVRFYLVSIIVCYFKGLWSLFEVSY